MTMTGSYLKRGLALLLGVWGIFALHGCARPSRPPGGPNDRIPPMVAVTWPDTFALIEPTRDAVRFDFSERISERPTQGRLEQAVVVSPVTGETQVKHTRKGLEVKVLGGYQPGLVYRVRVLTSIKDLFNNTLEDPFELVFSTGGEYEAHVLAGVVTDRISGEAIESVRVEARELVLSDSGVVVKEDAPAYLAVTDTAGIYLLRYVPSGSYRITVYQDNNRNQEPDFRELKGEIGKTLGQRLPVLDTLISDVALLASDSTVTQVVRVEAEDSTRIKVTFDDYLVPTEPLGSVEVALFVDSAEEEEAASEPGPAVQRILWQHELDSLMVVEDSIRAADSMVMVLDSLRVVADSLDVLFSVLQAAGDTVDAPGVETELESIRARLEPPDPEGEPEEEEEAEPPEPILPQQHFYVLLSDPMVSDQLYRLTASGVRNINGLTGGGGESGVTWTRPEPPPEDPAPTPGDTATAVPDTLAAVPDSIPPDTGQVFVTRPASRGSTVPFRGILSILKRKRAP
jgi:hypothetical protein